jgi:rare lipoprotein A
MKKRISIVFLLIAFLIGGVFFAQKLMPAKQNQKKASKDTISRKNSLAEKTMVIDTIAEFQGKFKLLKKSAHASYYADRFHGRRTASGRVYDKNKLTAAHKSLPFGTKVKVTNEANGKTVVVVITDRGPFVRGRDIDLSRKAFYSIASSSGMGYIKVTLEVLQK